MYAPLGTASVVSLYLEGSCRFGLERRLKHLLCLAPRPPHLLRHTTGIMSPLVAIGHFGIGLRRNL